MKQKNHIKVEYDTPFAKALSDAAERDRLRLHTPGHKGKLCELDVTELVDGAFPSEALEHAQRYAAKAYGAKHARYLCGGSSQGVKSAVYFADAGAVVDINSHRAVFDGFRLSGKPVTTAGEKGSVYPLTAEQIQKALTAKTQAVFVTTPTYYGFCADVDGIKEFCRRRGLLFIVDGAHGAHFGFSPLLPESVAPVCDICNLSTHKTLSALTQTALLLDNLDGSESARLGECADVMGTTSPSYILYASIDHAVRKAERSGDAYEKLFEPIAELKAELPFLSNDDFTRPVLDCEKLGIAPSALNGELVRRGVYAEKVDDRFIVFIFTAEDAPSDVAALKTALTESVSKLK